MRKFWESVKRGFAYGLMEGRYTYQLHIVDERQDAVIVVWAIDKRTYERNFTTVPRYHTAGESETVN